MSDTDHPTPSPVGSATTRASNLRLLERWFGIILALAGDILIIAALFSPWLEVFKRDPSFPPARGYSPWMVLQRGSLDALGVATVIFVLLTAGTVLGSLVGAFAGTATTQSLATYITVALALAGVLMTSLALAMLPTALALGYPYYDTNELYGAGLAAMGFSSVLLGVGIAGLGRRT